MSGCLVCAAVALFRKLSADRAPQALAVCRGHQASSCARADRAAQADRFRKRAGMRMAALHAGYDIGAPPVAARAA